MALTQTQKEYQDIVKEIEKIQDWTSEETNEILEKQAELQDELIDFAISQQYNNSIKSVDMMLQKAKNLELRMDIMDKLCLTISRWDTELC